MVKTGKTAGIVGVKTSLKTALKEGLEQGAKNLDNFKGVLRNAKSFGDTILSKVKTYGQQLDNLRPSKVLSKSAASLSNGLRHADNVLSEAAQNFRLNMGLEPQLVSGTIPSGGGKLSHLADNLSAFAKNLDGSVDEVVEAGSKNFKLEKEIIENTVKETDTILTEVKYGDHIIKGAQGKKRLLPNAQYVSEEGYKYTTDSLGRITSAQADELALGMAERNLYSQRTVGGIDRLADDDGGHLIASMFNGSGDIDNLVAMNSQINRTNGAWYEMEQEWKAALSEVPPKKVSVNIEPIYAKDSTSMRPESFEIFFQIEGKLPEMRTIMNKAGG